MRTCVGCRRRAPAMDLARTVMRSDGRLAVDRTAPGRGAWICRTPRTAFVQVACVDLAVRRAGFARALRIPVSTEAAGLLRATASEHAKIDGGAAVDVVPSGRD